MEEDLTDTVSKARIHPLIATTAVVIILVSIVGVAAITGLLRGSRSANLTPGPHEAEQMSSAAQADANKTTPGKTAALLAATEAPPPRATLRILWQGQKHSRGNTCQEN